jgi:hypothetical protein
MSCGKQNNEGVRFCMACGTPMTSATPATAPVETPVAPTVAEMPVAEAPPYTPPVAEAPAPAYYAPPPAPIAQQHEKGMNPLIVILPIVILLIGGVAAVFIFTDWINFGGSRQTASSNWDDRDRDNDRDRDRDNENDFPRIADGNEIQTFPYNVQDMPNDVIVTPDIMNPSDVVQLQELSSRGGDAVITSITTISFTPRESGLWAMYPNRFEDEPLFYIEDSDGSVLARMSDSDWGRGHGGHIIIYLDAGQTYTILAGFNRSDTGNYTLTVMPFSVQPISSRGGTIPIHDETFLSFTPDTTGIWEIFTSDNGGFDPFLNLHDSYWNLIGRDDDSAGNLNALITIHLNAGETYYIHASFYSGHTGHYTLNVAQPSSDTPSVVDIPAQPDPPTPTPNVPRDNILTGTDSVRVNGTTDFFITPRETATFEFLTSGNTGDPLLTIFDANDNRVARDDDSGGGLNARIVVELSAGVTYRVNAGFFASGTGSYTLTVTQMVSANSIPRGGGSLQIFGRTTLPFTPSQSGMWEFRTSGNVGDPLLTLRDSAGTQIARDDDGAGGLNSLIRIYLEGGVTYSLEAGFFASGTGSYTLTVTPLQSYTIPSGGGSVQVNGTTTFIFTPNRSATWEFLTHTNVGDPYLELYDSNGVMLAFNDDGGEGLNSFISMYLLAGETYVINARFWSTGTGSYTLTVTPN